MVVLQFEQSRASLPVSGNNQVHEVPEQEPRREPWRVRTGHARCTKTLPSVSSSAGEPPSSGAAHHLRPLTGHSDRSSPVSQLVPVQFFGPALLGLQRNLLRRHT